MSTPSDQPTATDEALAAAKAPPAQSPSLWRNRDYLILWSGQTISGFGSNISGFAFPLLVLFLTGSPAQAGFLGAVRSVPYLVFSLPVGALIDRWDRKRVMILCDTGRAVTLGSIPLVYVIVGTVSLVQLYLAAFIEGSLFVFFNIAEVACLPRVVTKQQLPAAIGQNQASDIAATLAGSPVSGLLFALGRMVPFLADAISYVVSVVSLFLIRAEFQGERTAERRKLRTEIGEGLRWLWNQPLIRFMAFLTGGLNFTSGMFLIIIVIAQRQHYGAPGNGLILTVGSVGGIVGSVIGPAIQKRFSFASVIITTSWLQLLFLLFAFSPNPLLMGLITAAIWVNSPVYNVVQMGYRLALIPDALQGRVNSIFRLLAFGFQPLGFALTGVLLQWLDVIPTVLFFGGCLLILAVATTLNPHVRHARPLAEVMTARG